MFACYDDGVAGNIDTHTVSPYRNRFGGDDFVGTRAITRDGCQTVSRTNVGPGTHRIVTDRIVHEKANDNVRVTANTVRIHDQNG